MAATSTGTRSYFDRMKSKGLSSRASSLGRTGLLVSKVGFGCYRVHEFEPDHREALRSALLSGSNLIDTSSNYTDGSAERLVGDVTSELFQSGELKRDEVVIVTKAGYVQGENLREAKAKQQAKTPFPEMVEFQPECWHNISPEYLDHQITKSLARMRLETIDIFLLHNPEYYLKASGNRETYYQRIEKAFRYLEEECKRGRIRYYGVSSNTFPEPESRSDFTSLTRIYEIAANITADHHFAVVQTPFNLFEAGAALIKNNSLDSSKKSGPVSTIEFASEKQLGVLTNRPFNAVQNGRLVRLTSFPTHDQIEIKGGLHTVLGRAIAMENSAPVASQGLKWAHVLRERLSEIDDLMGWKDVLFQQIIPSIRQGLARIPAEHQSWSHEYQNTMQELLRLITADLENLAEEKSKLIAENLQQITPSLESAPTLSSKMIRLYTSLPQINTVLVGMRHLRYVQDVLGEQTQIPEDEALETLRRLQRHRS